MPTGLRKTERVYVAATKASPATDEPVKRTATKAPAKKAPAVKAANGSAAVKRAAKSAPRAAKAEPGTTAKGHSAAKTTKAAPAKAGGPGTRGRAKKATSAERGATADESVEGGLETTDELEAEPGDDLEVDVADIELEDIEVDDDESAEGDTADDSAEGDAEPAAGAAPAAEDDEIAEPTEKDKASGDFVWDEEESEALRQARKDAELTASADSVRAYLKQIGKVALLNAEEEVELAKRIEAGLYATQLMAETPRRARSCPPPSAAT